MKYKKNGYNRLLVGGIYNLEIGILEDTSIGENQEIAEIEKGEKG